MESLYLLILIFFIVILTCPLGFEIKTNYSLKNNRGAFAIYLWKIKLKVAKIKFKGKQVYLIEKRKRTETEIELTEPQLKFLQFFNEEVRDKVKLKSVSGFMRLGFDNPFFASMFSAAASELILAFFAFLKKSKPTASLRLKTHTSFTEFNCMFAFNIKISLSILDILYSFLISILRTKTDRIFEEKIFINKK